jgi:hypothetical protein
MFCNPLRVSVSAGLGLALLCFPGSASAGSVSSVGLPIDLTSYPMTMATALTVQGGPNEYGGVSWNGSADVRLGDATAQSFTRTVAELRDLGINGRTFGLMLTGNELPGQTSLQVPKFSLQFYSSDGATLFEANYSAKPGESSIPGFGPKDGTGWLYRVTLTEDEAGLFYANDANRVGILIERTSPLGNTSGGPESLSLMQFDLTCDPQVPEPASVLVWICGAAGTWTFRRLRRSRKPLES